MIDTRNVLIPGSILNIWVILLFYEGNFAYTYHSESYTRYITLSMCYIDQLHLFSCWRKITYKQKNFRKLADLFKVGTFKLSSSWIVQHIGASGL